MKNDLLLKIAEKGYIVGYGACLNFATFDIVKKCPGRLAFLSIVVGILGLAWPGFAGTFVSIIVLILGIVSIYIERFTYDIDSYGKRGVTNTNQLNYLKNLYYEVKAMEENADFSDIEAKYVAIEQEFNYGSQPNQILFSNWLAHFKFFCEKDVSWMDEQLHFGCWKDKIPKTAHICIYIFILIVIVYYCVKVPVLNEFFSNILIIDN